MRRWKRRLLWVVLALAGLATLTWLLLPEPIPVDVAAVERGPLEVSVEEEGRTRVRDHYVVSAPLAGHLRRIELEAGDEVEAGEALAIVDPPAPALLDRRTRAQAEARVDAAQATVARAEAELERALVELAFAEDERERIERLVERDAATRHELREVERDYRVQRQRMEVARLEQQIAEHELAQAHAVLAITTERARPEDPEPLTIVAPTTGRVLRVRQESEAFVNAGTALLELGDPRRLEVVVDLLSEDAARVEIGAMAYLERWGGAATLQGRVRRVEPSGFTDISALGVEEQRVNVIIDFVEPPEAYAPLGDGYRVDASIVTWRADDALRVPTGALFREGEQWMVFKVEQGRAVLRAVEIGRQTPLMAEVVGGLVEGDRVVMYPGDRMADGARVTTR